MIYSGASFCYHESKPFFKTFSWSFWEFGGFEICGFFTPRQENSVNKIAQSCLESKIDKHSSPKVVMDWLKGLANSLSQTSNHFSGYGDHYSLPMQLGIIVKHGEFFYQATLGCTAKLYPSDSECRFSSELEILGPNPILNNGTDIPSFIMIASSGLINFLRSQNIRYPIRTIEDKLRLAFHDCQNPG